MTTSSLLRMLRQTGGVDRRGREDVAEVHAAFVAADATAGRDLLIVLPLGEIGLERGVAQGGRRDHRLRLAPLRSLVQPLRVDQEVVLPDGSLYGRLVGGVAAGGPGQRIEPGRLDRTSRHVVG